MNFIITSSMHANTTESGRYFMNNIFGTYSFLIDRNELIYKPDLLKRIKQLLLIETDTNTTLETFYHAAENVDFLSISKLHNSSISIHY